MKGSDFLTYRNLAKLKQRELAQKLGCTVATVSAWERGVASPGLRMRWQLHKHLGIPAEDLLRPDSDLPTATGAGPHTSRKVDTTGWHSS